MVMAPGTNSPAGDEPIAQKRSRLRVLDDYDAIVDACCKAWNELLAMPDRLASITQRNWAKGS